MSDLLSIIAAPAVLVGGLWLSEQPWMLKFWERLVAPLRWVEGRARAHLDRPRPRHRA